MQGRWYFFKRVKRHHAAALSSLFALWVRYALNSFSAFYKLFDKQDASVCKTYYILNINLGRIHAMPQQIDDYCDNYLNNYISVWFSLTYETSQRFETIKIVCVCENNHLVRNIPKYTCMHNYCYLQNSIIIEIIDRGKLFLLEILIKNIKKVFLWTEIVIFSYF